MANVFVSLAAASASIAAATAAAAHPAPVDELGSERVSYKTPNGHGDDDGTPRLGGGRRLTNSLVRFARSALGGHSDDDDPERSASSPAPRTLSDGGTAEPPLFWEASAHAPSASSSAEPTDAEAAAAAVSLALALAKRDRRRSAPGDAAQSVGPGGGDNIMRANVAAAVAAAASLATRDRLPWDEPPARTVFIHVPKTGGHALKGPPCAPAAERPLLT